MQTFLRTAITALSLLFAGAACADVVSSSQHGFQIKIEQATESSAQQGYQHFVNHVGQWWLSDHTWFGDASKLSIEATAGGCFCERDGDQQALHMLVSYVDPGNTLRLVGGLGPLQALGLSGTMTISFSEQKVTLNYIVGGYPTTDLVELAPIVDRVLSQQLQAFSQFSD